MTEDEQRAAFVALCQCRQCRGEPCHHGVKRDCDVCLDEEETRRLADLAGKERT